MDVHDYLNNLKKISYVAKTPKDAWLTVNRLCNMRCPWCYANNVEDSLQNDMDFDSAKKLVQVLSDYGVEHITIIGGEPTLYPNLIALIRFITKKGIRVTLVTNGLLLSDFSICEELKKVGVETISISVKGCSDFEYSKLTKHDNSYTKVLQSIKNVTDLDIGLSVSYVIHENVSPLFFDMISQCKNAGVKHFSFSFCYDFTNMDVKVVNYDIEEKIFKPLRWFENNYEKIHSLTDGNFRMKQSLPLCSWSEEVLKKMDERGQFSYVCQVMKQSGIVFDSEFNMIPCNAMHKIKLGKYPIDFNNIEQLKSFLESPEMKRIYGKFKSLPSEKCYKCEKKIKCRGGCLSNWFNFSFDDFYEKMKSMKNGE